jgi:hypothetical protein
MENKPLRQELHAVFAVTRMFGQSNTTTFFRRRSAAFNTAECMTAINRRFTLDE